MALKCFIAMAFDRDDTDALYDRAIRPILKRKNISVFRVDRSNRNDDIDDQILLELRQCDFVIADLTYARPSVYFEAGVAHGRGAHVIYTCRKDHFKHRPDDKHGNLRVHFDLQMKPIIAWSSSTNAAFSKRLISRIDHVVRPLLKRRQISQKAEAERLAFDGLSISEKLTLFEVCNRRVIRRYGFDVGKEPIDKSTPPYVMGIDARRVFMKTRGRLLTVVIPSAYSSISQNELRWKAFMRNAPLSRLLTLRGRPKNLPEAVTEHLFCCVLQNVPFSRVAAALPQFKVTKTKFGCIATGEPTMEYATGSDYSGRDYKQTQKEISVLRHVHVICKIESESQFREALKEHLQFADQIPMIWTKAAGVD